MALPTYDPKSLWFAERVLQDELSWIELQDMMPHPLTGVRPYQAVVQAARTSYVGQSKGGKQDKQLLRFLWKNRHTSPFEMVELKFRAYAPVVFWWQMVRHRTGSFNLQSGRYMAFEEDAMYTPLYWRRNDSDNKQAANTPLAEEKALAWQNRLYDHQQASFRLYEEALADGVAKEQARFFLPAWTSYYVGVFKFDLHNLLHFLKLRTATEAQWEIRQYALAVEACLMEVEPELMEMLETLDS